MPSTTDIMKWVINVIGPVNKDAKALDVATGTGIFARALSDAGCSSVLGIDATIEMLDQARDTEPTVDSNAPAYLQCDAASMPFPDDSFDLVTCRLAVHHFAHPQIQLQEMARVCKPGGKVVVVDLVSVGDTKAAAEHNRLEILRDPSHTQALFRLCNLVANEKLKVVNSSNCDMDKIPRIEVLMDLEAWMESTNTLNDAREEIRTSML